MNKKCEKCPMNDKGHCQCEYCTYNKSKSPITDKDDIGKRPEIKNIFLNDGISNKISGLLKEIPRASNYELRQILYAVWKEQERRNSRVRMRAARKRNSKSPEDKDEN